MFESRLKKIEELVLASGVDPKDLQVTDDFEAGVSTLYYKDKEITKITGVTLTNDWAAHIYLMEYVARHGVT